MREVVGQWVLGPPNKQTRNSRREQANNDRLALPSDRGFFCSTNHPREQLNERRKLSAHYSEDLKSEHESPNLL